MPTSRQFYVYIMTNYSRTLYVGVTNDLLRRVQSHKEKLHPKSFTARYNVQFLIYYEVGENILAVIAREKQIKGWVRKKKIVLIENMNPTWRDLSEDL